MNSCIEFFFDTKTEHQKIGMESTKCKEIKISPTKVGKCFIKDQQNLYACNMCDKSFFTSSKLREHLNLHSSIKKPFDCTSCGKTLLTGRAIKKHLLSCSETKLPCSICRRKFNSQEEVQLHMENHKKFQCEECPETFAMKYLLSRHLKVHAQRFFVECDFCQVICDDEDSLKEHLDSRTGDQRQAGAGGKQPKPKKFKCRLCRRAFWNECRLKQHSVTCNTLAFTCHKCLLSYKTKFGLENHPCRKKDTVYTCNVCSQAFDVKEDLFQHFFVHKFTQGINLCM